MERTYREPERRGAPYVWVTWLTKLLAGENHCEWALWFKSRHYFDKLETGFDLDRWIREHDELVQWRAQKLRDQNLFVRIEDENGFRVEGKSGTTIAGKPDIAVYREGQVVYEDCKTGKRRESDHIQVLLYAMLTRRHVDGEVGGSIIYTDGVEDVDMDRLADLTQRFKALMVRVNEDEPPARTPSYAECRFCDIAKFYCPDRIQDTSNRIYKTDDF